MNREALSKHSALPLDRLIYHAATGLDLLGRIQNGVVLILAWWSGPALAAFRGYTRQLASASLPNSFEVHVVDIDGVPDFYQAPQLHGRLSGACEVIFVREGRIEMVLPVRDAAAFDHELRSRTSTSS